MTAPAIRFAAGAEAVALVDDGWDRLALAQERAQATAGRQWMAAAVARAGRHALVARAERDGLPVAAIALDVRSLTPRGGPPVGRLLGAPRPVSGADLLVASEDPTAGRELLRALATRVAALEFTVSSDGPLASLLPAVYPWAQESAPDLARWRLELPGAQLERRRDRVAYHLRRAERRGARIERRLHVDPESLGPALERLFDLHRNRWHGRADAVPFSSEAADRAWHRGAVAAAAAAGRARIAEVAEDGRPVASILVLLAGSAANLYVGAIAPGGTLKGPGHVAILGAVEAAMAAGARVVDLGRGEEEYKMRFAPTADPSVRLVAATRAAWQVPLIAALAVQRRAVRARRHLRRGANL